MTNDAALIETVHHLVGPDIELTGITFRNPRPGSGAPRQHADALPMLTIESAQVATAIVAFIDFTESNGATRVVPGTHRRLFRVGPAGTAFAFSAHLLHSGRSTSQAGDLSRTDSELRTDRDRLTDSVSHLVTLPIKSRGVRLSLIHKAVTFDCADATVVSQFWSAVLGRPIDTEPMPPSPFFASIGIGDPSRIGYMFIQVPESKTAKNRVHLDLESDDVTAEIARIMSLGATHIHDKDEFNMQWTTLADPAPVGRHVR